MAAQRALGAGKSLELDANELQLARASIDMAISSAQRMQNAKAATIYVKQAYAQNEQELRALRVKFD